MDTLLNRAAQRAELAEVYHLRCDTIPVVFRAGALESIDTKQLAGAALRVVCDGKLGYATTTDLARPEDLVEAAVSGAAFGESVSLAVPSETPPANADLMSGSLERVTMDDLVDLGERAVSRVTDVAPGTEIGVRVTKTIDRIVIENSAGLRAEEARGGVRLSVELSKASKDDILVLVEEIAARSVADVDLDGLVDRIGRYLGWSERLVPAPSGEMPVVFTTQGAIAPLLPLVFGCSGRLALLGMSPLKDRIGEAAFDSRFSLIDDPTLAAGSSACGFDDEGMRARRTALVSDGVAAGFYYDLRTAELAETESTGNGFKGGLLGGANFRNPPSASISNLAVGPGEGTMDDLIREVGDGLLVDTVLGLGQGNLNSGDFSNNLGVAFRIEGGKVVGRVKNAMIAGNSYALLKDHLIGIAETPRWVLFGRLHTPAMALSGVSVAAK